MGEAKRRKMRGEYPAMTTKKRARPGLNPDAELLASCNSILELCSEEQINEANRIFFNAKSIVSEIHPLILSIATANAIVSERAVVDHDGLHLIRPTKIDVKTGSPSWSPWMI